MAHGTHHVVHGQPLDGIECWDGSVQSLTHRQRGPCISCPIHRLRKDRVSVVTWLDDDIDSFTRPEAELIDRDGLHVHTIDMDDGELQAGNADVIEGITGSIDHTQPDALTPAEQRRPVASRCHTISKIGQRRGRQISEICWTHPHLVPHLARADCACHSIAHGVAEEVEDRRLVVVVIVALRLEFAENPHRRFVGPVREQQHMVAVGVNGLRAGRVDDDRAVHAGEFLKAGMGMIPVGAALLNLEAIGEGFARRDTVEADARNAVHLKWQNDAVPVDGSGFTQRVGDPDRNRFSFAPTQGRPG